MRWQLPIVWLIGSLVTGTIAALLTTGVPDFPIKPLLYLSRPAALTLVLLVVVLVFALYVLGWRTIEATWLRWQDPRSVVLWTILVAGGGFLGWGFAAAVTFEAGFPLAAQLVLAYTCGGLPFTLIAAMLARPWQVNAAATMVTFVAGLTGFAMMDAPLRTMVLYLQILVSGVTPL